MPNVKRGELFISWKCWKFRHYLCYILYIYMYISNFWFFSLSLICFSLCSSGVLCCILICTVYVVHTVANTVQCKATVPNVSVLVLSKCYSFLLSLRNKSISHMSFLKTFFVLLFVLLPINTIICLIVLKLLIWQQT